MKNVLKKIEKDETQYFVMKSYRYSPIDEDRRKPEFHIFFVKNNSKPEAYYDGYRNLKIRKMNKLEIVHFKENIKNYKEDLRNNDGIVYVLKEKPFNKENCKMCLQTVMF